MTRLQRSLAVLALILSGSGDTLADSAGTVAPSSFSQTSGQAIYAVVCQGCHMPDAKGAVGAGAYPALAADTNLQSAGYPIYLVLYGQRAMPGFGGFLNDAQVAAVVGYIRTHFGNDYKDGVTAADVKAARQPGYRYYTLD